MRGLVWRGTWLAVALIAQHGCGASGAAAPDTPCDRGELEACGDGCSTDLDCTRGLHCAGGSCRAECTGASAARDCAGGRCSADGRCEAVSAEPDVDDDIDEGLCAEVELFARPATPNVIFIIDQSDSMNYAFGSSNRWAVLKESLLGDGGVIAALQHEVRFGLALYSAQEGGVCPLVTRVDVALDNLQAISDVFGPANTIRETPTGDAIEQVLSSVDFLDAQDPTIFVLATDGEPDRCEELNPQQGQAESLAAIDHAYSLGIRTYVIGVAEEHELSNQHLQDLANAGIGMTNAPKYRANDDAALRTALSSIVGGEVACVIPLDGQVIGDDPCIGTVEVNGKPAQCNGPDGYRLLNPSTIEFVGSACEELKATRVLEARFPCESVILL